MITADREFHSIFLSHWLKKYQRPDVYFVLRQKKSTIIKQGKKYCQDLRRQTPQTRFIVDIYVLKTMIYFLKRVSLGKS